MADKFAKVNEARIGATTPQSHDALDIGKEAAAVSFGKPSTLNAAEEAAYKGLLSAYADGKLTPALKHLHSLAGGSPEKVAGRLLFHLAHGHEQPAEKQAMAAALKEFPNAANMQLNDKHANFYDLLKTGKTFNDFSDDKVDIARWSKEDVARLQAAAISPSSGAVSHATLLGKGRSEPQRNH